MYLGKRIVMNNSGAKWLFYCLLIGIGFSGCVSSPPAADSSKPPAWVIERPADDDSFMYFRGSGTSAGGDSAEAGQVATGELFADIMRYMGVQVTSDTTATARGGVDAFQTEIVQAVKQKGSARVAGFEIMETWLDHKHAPAVTVYQLARYNKQELLKEKARLEALIREKVEAIAGPEREGNSLLAENRYYEAAIQFMIAAASAYKSDVDNASVKFKRNIDQAMGAIEKINLIKMNDNLTGLAGQAMPEPFKLKVVSGATETDRGIPNVALKVNYAELQVTSGKMRYLETSLKTDGQGLMVFPYPVPRFVGPSQVTVLLDLGSYIEALDDVPKEQKGLVDGLEELLIKKKTAFSFTISSNAKNIKTGILLIDYDENGAVRGVTETAAAVQGVLNGFNLVLVNKTASFFKDKSEADIYEALRQEYQGKTERLIVGTIRILNFTERSGKYFAKASGAVKVYELTTDSVLYTSSKEKSAMGNTQAEAANQVLKELGKTIGTDIKNNLN